MSEDWPAYTNPYPALADEPLQREHAARLSFSFFMDRDVALQSIVRDVQSYAFGSPEEGQIAPDAEAIIHFIRQKLQVYSPTLGPEAVALCHEEGYQYLLQHPYATTEDIIQFMERRAEIYTPKVSKMAAFRYIIEKVFASPAPLRSTHYSSAA